MWQLIVDGGRHNGRIIRIRRGPLLVGRDRECHIRPQSRTINGRHCALDVRAGRLFVRDLQGSNGTLLNEHPVQGEAELKRGDRLQIGTLVFVVGWQTTPVVPTVQGRTVDEDTIAEMLLAMDDETPSQSHGKAFSGLDTTSDVVALGETLPGSGAAPPIAPKLIDAGSTTAKAAEELLEKYVRGPALRRETKT